MDGSQFDRLARGLATGASRRSVLKGMLGLGAAAVTVDEVQAARRPTPTPKPVSCPGQQHWDGAKCACPAGSSKCGSDCCPDGQAECCDNACCYGECYGEELCCPTGSIFCNGVCLDDGRCCSDMDCTSLDDPTICAIGRCREGLCVEGYSCVGLEAPRCCGDGTCADMWVDGNCCNDGECPGGYCDLETHICVCTPDCSTAGCGGDDGCGGICETCPGGVCINGGCFLTCQTDDDCPSESCPDCQCAGAKAGGLYCLNAGLPIARCATNAECDSGSLCSVYGSDHPEQTNICLLPCCVEL